MLTILKEYHLQPRYIEKIGKMYKVYAQDEIVGLKGMEIQKGLEMIQSHQLLYNKGFLRFVPIYLTKNRNNGVMVANQFYYLIPWLKGSNMARHEKKGEYMFRELARMHSLTAKEISINEKEVEEHHQQTKLRWEKEMNVFDRVMDVFEQKWYMSPFEWLFVENYHQIRQAFDYAFTMLNQWYELIMEKKKTRTVLIHGKLSFDHYIFDEKGYGYFINLENSRITSPYYDLLPFFSHWLDSYPTECSECVEWLSMYNKYFPLREEERKLLKAYFAYPGAIIDVLSEYFQVKKINHELELTKKLQQKLWYMKNIEYLIMQMERSEIHQQATP